MQAIAHDLINPLQVLTLKLNFLKRIDEPQKIHKEIDSLKSQTQRLVNITNELVSHLKI
jgi:signal transduction histidine kinase